jgi:hypothetical protein
MNGKDDKPISKDRNIRTRIGLSVESKSTHTALHPFCGVSGRWHFEDISVVANFAGSVFRQTFLNLLAIFEFHDPHVAVVACP